ncbi:Ulp1 protease family C-terminal catalytic domain [Phytophthora infestans]|uniref:Ulp1 protease family C-terminal catalytic domain n=1 Tax=Phytophthora infestans TaxID=4787 RepID=A0A833WE30_PHYIN|nr:Ulp1 protease family C-terminal catalytic domain [Phytophthora infestans]KAF4143532.1 Ulp1 protease family C-terminal catalytic domain-containing protein [Phytophthora infestans]
MNKLIDTRFEQVQAHELAVFRGSDWLDDSCFKLVMSHLINQEQDEKGGSRIGGVNPLFARVHNEAMKHEVIANSPCQTTDRLILIPLYLESHWAGILLDCENGKALLFDPMQAMTNYKEIRNFLDKYFLECVENLDRQEDTNSCGPLTLFFFEYAVRGIPAPKMSRKKIEYLRFRYFFLTSQGVFCRSQTKPRMMHNCA